MASDRPQWYAHSAPKNRTEWEPWIEHATRVADRAGELAEALDRKEEAWVAGALHDLGKCAERFHDRLAGKEPGLDHWSAGAWAAMQRFGLAGIQLAVAIQGHHVGLQKATKPALRELQPAHLSKHHPLGLGLTEPDVDLLLERARREGLDLPKTLQAGFDFDAPTTASSMADIRMLFSTLVDADYLETEAHFRRDAQGRRLYRKAGRELDARAAADVVEGHVSRLAAKASEDRRADPRVLQLRNDLFQACLEAAERRPATYTLGAPTGAGKTLAMLAFALRHAEQHGLRRIVLAVPYLSILEQTVGIYRDLFDKVFGSDFVLEHHSLAGTWTKKRLEKEQVDKERVDEQHPRLQRARELAENWDAPIVLTTSVQLLESLHANRPRACRKLHRLARSVILLDEVQTLPPWLAVPTLATLSHLAEEYGSTVVFATATQPAFEHLHDRVQCFAAPGWTPPEIVPKELGLSDRIRRVEVEWRIDNPTSWEDLAEEIKDHPRVLIVVNLKRHAKELVRRLKGFPGLCHLSTNLCSAHREKVLEDVRRRLDTPDEPCVLISTQCVEAGVDVDFPVLYRAFGPLDSIVQAAGRCNRGGGLPGLGRVIVFLPEQEDDEFLYPPGGYKKAAQVTELLCKRLGSEAMDLRDPELFRTYYQDLYDLDGITEGAGLEKLEELEDAVKNRDFPAVAERYRLIDKDAIDVVVPYDRDAFEDLHAEVEGENYVTLEWLQKARPHMVSVYRPGPRADLWSFLEPAVRETEKRKDEVYFLLDFDGESPYDDLLGIKTPPRTWIA